MLIRWISLFGCPLLFFVLAGCAVQPFRPYTKLAHARTVCDAPAAAESVRITPEIPEDTSYTLHFVEFDDQGWAFDDEAGATSGTPSRQIDCAISDIRSKLSEAEDAKVLTFVYVHGWKHSADNGDPDVQKFRRLLRTRATLLPDRKIVGIYVAWQGNTVDVWGIRNLTFWGRKNAAAHVAEGRVRELFARIKGLREYWNSQSPSPGRDCDWNPSEEDRCRLRTIMIGHSFGGLILFNSASPYLIEILSQHRDRPPGAVMPRLARAKTIADLIVLINPAFEASRYEAVFQAAQSYRTQTTEPPLLVSITSLADWATKNAFPVARLVNTIFQYPASTEEQSTAMRRTHGHIDAYLTHTLCIEGADCAKPAASGPQNPALRAVRRYCGGLVLKAHHPEVDWKSIVWNIRTDEPIINNHNHIDGVHLLRFITQIYGDTTGLTTDACDPAFFATEAELADNSATEPDILQASRDAGAAEIAAP